MMTPIGWIALLLLWILFFWIYRDYRLDLFRQKLFSLRDDLFDMAIEGKISFDDPAYGMLRSTINGTIQFGHQLGFLDLLCMVLLRRRNSVDENLASRFNQKWMAACNTFDAETNDRLRSIRYRLHFAIIEQIVFTSFLLMASIVALVAILLMKTVAKRCVDRIFSTAEMKRLLSFLDYSAAMHAS